MFKIEIIIYLIIYYPIVSEADIFIYVKMKTKYLWYTIEYIYIYIYIYIYSNNIVINLNPLNSLIYNYLKYVNI